MDYRAWCLMLATVAASAVDASKAASFGNNRRLLNTPFDESAAILNTVVGNSVRGETLTENTEAAVAVLSTGIIVAIALGGILLLAAIIGCCICCCRGCCGKDSNTVVVYQPPPSSAAPGMVLHNVVSGVPQAYPNQEARLPPAYDANYGGAVDGFVNPVAATVK